MIYSRPNKTLVWGLVGFLLASGVVMYFLVGQLLASWAWYFWGMFLFLLITFTVVAAKGALNYKKVRLKGSKLLLHYPFRPLKKQYALPQDIDYWRTEGIKAAGQPYRLLTIVFTDGHHLSMSNYEDSGYRQILDHLEKKYKKQQRG